MKMLIDPLLKYGDLVCLVSPPGVGKSILSVQIGIAVARGGAVELLPNSSVEVPQRVFYYDGEMDDEDMADRYGKLPPIPNFRRISKCSFRNHYYLLKDVMERAMSVHGDVTVIVDNLFSILPLLRHNQFLVLRNGIAAIQEMKKARGEYLTVIIVCHTTKTLKRIPTLEDVGGSANITRFVNSVVYLHQSTKAADVVFLLPLKRRYARAAEVYLLQRSDKGYLHFEHISTAKRSEIGDEDARPAPSDEQKPKSKVTEEVRKRVFELHDENLSCQKIADALKSEGFESVSKQTVWKLIKQEAGSESEEGG